jgi:hypothetical protein
MKRNILFLILSISTITLAFFVFQLKHKNEKLENEVSNLDSINMLQAQEIREFETFETSVYEILNKFNPDLAFEKKYFVNQMESLIYKAFKTSDSLKFRINNFDLLNQSLSELNAKQRSELLAVQGDLMHKDHFTNLKLIHLENQTDSLENLLNTVRELYSKSKTDTIKFLSSKNVEVIYYGQLFNKLPYGFGIGLYIGRGNYVGEWDGENRHGQGRHAYLNGDVYEGQFVRDQRSGYGIYYYASGEVYRGEWKNDLMHGKGEIKMSNGKTVSGTWVEGKMKENLP